MNPVCVKCQLQMWRVKTGADVELMAGKDPYQIWNVDIFKCDLCGVEIIGGFASRPTAELHQAQRYEAFAKGVTLRFWAGMADLKGRS